jgi:energy-coupling factor transport system ATP-binding protein
MKKIDKYNISVAEGLNFSGRSQFLKMEAKNKGIYIGEIPSNYMSGVSPTVIDELDLFSYKSSEATKKGVDELISKLSFNRLFESNPFLLSGGEQVMLIILSSILSEPKIIAIDTAIEQLSEEWKVPLFTLILEKLKHQKFILSDNRIEEYKIPFEGKQFAESKKIYESKFNKPSLIKLKNEISSEVVTINNLWFGYKKNNPILKSLNLVLEPGTIYFLKGTNGAGKSTLAKILSGVLQVRKGEIQVNKSNYNPYKIPGNLFGYSFQNPDEQLFSRTVENEILIPIKNENDGYKERRELFLKMFGLENVRGLHPAELPFVMRKRIALASTLANDRPWYIIDEPTIGQDDNYTNFLEILFTYLASIGKGIVVISHSINFISKFEAKTLYLDNGCLTIN